MPQRRRQRVLEHERSNHQPHSRPIRTVPTTTTMGPAGNQNPHTGTFGTRTSTRKPERGGRAACGTGVSPDNHRRRHAQTGRRHLSPMGHRRAGSQAGVPRWMAGGEPRNDQAAGTDGGPIDCLPGEGPRPLRPGCRHLPSVRRGSRGHHGPRGAGLGVRQVQHDYVGQEARANTDRLGVHAHGCQPAWEWRAEQRPVPSNRHSEKR